MRKMGIQGRIKHQYITTTNSKHNNKIYSNLIKDKELTGINQVWCSDITFIRILNGFIYLATRKTDNLIHHSDQGIQYTCKEYIKILKDNGIRISM